MKTLQISIALILTLLMIACNNGSNDSQDLNESITQTTQEELNPAGIWIGYQTILTEDGRGVFDMKTLIYDGKFYGVSEDANILYSGSYEMVHGKYLVTNGMEDSNTKYRLYSISDNGNAFANGMTALHIKEEESFSGAFENDILQEGEVSAIFTQLYSKPSSLEYIYGDVNTSKANLNITQLGIISGTLKNCQIDGTISVPDSSINMYKLNFTLESCSDSGTYNGLGVVALDSNNKAYFMALAEDEESSRMEAFLDYLQVTPVEFLESSLEKRSAERDDILELYSDKKGILGNFENIDFNNLDYSGIDIFSFKDSKLQSANLNFIKAIGLSFENSNCTRSDETGMAIDRSSSGATFKNAILTEANFKNANLESTDFYRADLKKVNFENAVLSHANLEGADLEGAKLASAIIIGTNFNYANLKDSDKKHYEITNLDQRANVFLNTWWTDGSRCNSLSIGNCFPKLFDNGLTYEEYLSGKDDLDKDIEVVGKAVGDLTDNGVQLLESIGNNISDTAEDIGSSVSTLFCGVWGC